jgi:polyisoprenoid-binding protein YceI
VSRAWSPAWLLAVAALLAATPAGAYEIDAATSRAGFSLVTRWGQVVDGVFPVLDGRLSRLSDGRRQVQVSLSTADVEIIGSLRHTHLTRGRGFFDAERYPWVTFVSDPFDARLLVDGGPLPGVLHIRDVQHRETFTVAPSACARPALDCPVVAHGVVERASYGMNRWAFAIGGKVRFQFHIRAEGGGG